CGRVKLNPVTMDAAVVNGTSNAVTGGTYAQLGSWPWTVSICQVDWFGNCAFKAAGAIIGDRWVATSCMALPDKDTTYRVQAGVLDHNN
ncbi:hypothetical protein PFISCL1PPCAC_8167, partial [Pristionchus fissidentatus]